MVNQSLLFRPLYFEIATQHDAWSISHCYFVRCTLKLPPNMMHGQSVIVISSVVLWNCHPTWRVWRHPQELNSWSLLNVPLPDSRHFSAAMNLQTQSNVRPFPFTYSSGNSQFKSDSGWPHACMTCATECLINCAIFQFLLRPWWWRSLKNY